MNRTITNKGKSFKITPTDSSPEDGQSLIDFDMLDLDSDTTSHGVHRSNNEFGEEDNKVVDGKEEEDVTAGLESADDNS